jgi:hypothetical protein
MRIIKYHVANANEDVKKCQDEVHGFSAKAKYTQIISDILRRETCNFTNKAVEEAKRIKDKAMDDMRRLGSQADNIVTSATNSIDMMAGLETVLKEIDRVHSTAKNDLEVVAAQLDRDRKDVAAKLDKLMEIVK